MNFNVIAYVVYLSITAYIIIVVGKICYRNGNIFVSELIPGHEDLCHRINKMLLIGYYLTNLGYAAMALASWKVVENYTDVIETVASKTATIVCLLCVMHYFNIFIITKYIHKLIH